MALTSSDFISPVGELPLDLFGLEDLAAKVDGVLAVVAAQVAAVTTDEAVGNSITRHGVLASIYRQAAVYWAKRPSSAQLADQGGMTWSNPSQLYEALALQEQKDLEDGLEAAGAAVVQQFPSGAVPTVIRP